VRCVSDAALVRRALAILAAFVALGAGAPVGAAASPRLNDEAVKSIVARDTRVTGVEAGHPLSQWTAVFERATGLWAASLREPGHAPLARATVRDRDGRVLRLTVEPTASEPGHRLTLDQATAIAERSPKVQDWVMRYRTHGYAVTSQTLWDNDQKVWIRHWWSRGEEIARISVDDAQERIRDAWTGPQVAWSMARGSSGAFGKKVNDPWVFVPVLLVFVLGLLDWRRLLSVRTVDVLALGGFSVSLWYFNRGLVFWSVPLAYPPLVYVFCRLLYVGLSRRGQAAYTTRLPVWLCAALAVFALGFRAGLNFWDSNVIDVGYAGVAGADRLLHGTSPYDHMPKQTGKPCGARYSDGSWSAYVQADGRCESPVERGDTYGPVMYDAYVPFTAALGWSGRWDDLPAAHGTAVLFDALAAAGLALAGFRLGGRRLALAALFFWATFPFTLYAMSSNSNDAVVGALVAWTFAALSFPFLRGLVLGLAGWAKFAPLMLVPLLVRADREPYREPEEWPFGDHPSILRRPTRLARLGRALRPGPGSGRVVAGFAVATAASFGVLVVLDGPGAIVTFWNRTFGWQLDRPSPFSIWDWGGYPGFPDLAVPQKLLKAGLVLFALVLYVLPRRLDPARIAALGGALLVGFQLLLTHWFYLYIPWWTPCVALALLAPRPARERALAPAPAPVPAVRPALVPAELAQ